MLFQNMWLLLGLLAVAIPIIIHLLNRQTARTIQWGAIQFLLASVINRKRRIMLEEVLLLGARCLILALVAMAIARPFVPPGSHVPYMIILPLILLAIVLFGVSFAMSQYARWAIGFRIAGAVLIVLAILAVALEKKLNLGRFSLSSSQSIALVIDGSASMTIQIDGKSNFERALAEAGRLVETAGRGTDFSVILAGSFPVTVVGAPASDRVKVMAAIEELKPTAGSAKIPAALSAALVALSQGSCPAKKIVLITDGQRIGWEIEQPERWRFIGDTFAKLNPQPDVVVRKLPLPQHFRNMGVAAIDFSRDAIGIDREVGINVRVSNTGSEAVTPSELKLKVDDETLTDRTIGQVEPGSSETIRFNYRFKKAGTHTMVAELVLKDDMPADDTCCAAVNVIGGLRVLLIDGNPSARFLDGAAAFAALAMAPGEETPAGAKQAGGPRHEHGENRFLIEPRIVDIMTLGDVGSLEAYDAVVLADVPRLPAGMADELSTYVYSGGGLLVAPGENSQRDFYNTWWMGTGNRVMPADFATRVTTKPGEEGKLSMTTLEHRAFRSIKESGKSDIGTLTVSTYWKLGETTGDGAVTVGARMNNGDAFLAERRLGKGLVLLTACSLDTRGSNLAGRNLFVPLVHELVYYLSNPARPNLNVAPGPEIALRLTSRKLGKLQNSEIPVDVLGPGGLKSKGRALNTFSGAFVRLEGLQRPGVYHVIVPDVLKESWLSLTAGDNTIAFAVSQDIGESHMDALAAADMAMIGKFTRLSQPATADEARQLLAGKTFGQELWRPLALAALLVLLLEAGITRWIAARRRTSQGTNVNFEARNKPILSFQAEVERLRNAD